jgi:hypothetical protein
MSWIYIGTCIACSGTFHYMKISVRMGLPPVSERQSIEWGFGLIAEDRFKPFFSSVLCLLRKLVAAAASHVMLKTHVHA